MKKIILTFAIAGLSLASAKSYDLTLYNPVNIGASTIKSGMYKLEVKGDRLLLKDGKKTDEFPVQVQNDSQKFDNTTLTVSSANGTAQIQEIHLRGTHVKLVFNN